MRQNFLDLTGQVAFCCGASSGIGLQFAKALASQGADLVLAAEQLEQLEKNAWCIEREYQVRCYFHEMDLGDSASITKAVEFALDRLGHIEILSNATAYSGLTDPALLSSEDWAKIIERDLNGRFFLCREVGRLAMIPRHYGRIINVSSLFAVKSFCGFPAGPVAAAAGGVAAFTKAVANDWAQYYIAVNCIAPGFFVTNTAPEILDSPEFQNLCTEHCPMGRAGNREELNGLVAYLASRSCSYMTGQQIVVDGGMSLV